MQTIAAIGTPLGEGGIAIIRISGQGALAILQQVFHPVQAGRRMISRRLYLGHIVNQQGERLDQALAVWMRGPATYTGEDVVELHVHGGPLLAKEVLRLVLAGGARLAEPGEFTQRAFLAGKLDLLQAEAVIDLIRASTGLAAKQAERHLDGELSARVAGFREQLLGVLAQIAASVDFPEHEIPELEGARLADKLQGLAASMQRLLDTGFAGRLLREGVQVVITGRPNVGKSSLLNALLGREKAIVSEYAGTTRDIVEDYLSFEGIPVRLMDTAGVHAANDPVEQIGVRRAQQAIAAADLLLVVIDQSVALQTEDRAILQQTADRSRLVVANKSDLPTGLHSEPELVHERVLPVSAVTGSGLAELRQEVMHALLGQPWLEGGLMLANARQEELLRQAVEAVRAAWQAAEGRLPLDMLTVDLQAAHDALGAMLGATVNEDVIEQIFSRFCIGK